MKYTDVDIKKSKKEGALMNKTISYGSFEELGAHEAREKRHDIGPTSDKSILQRPGLKRVLTEIMEKNDPGGNMAHELTAEIRSK